MIGDLITPFKSAVGFDYKALERRLLAAIHLRFGLPANPPETLKRLVTRADRAAAYLEATQLAGFSEAEATRILRRPRGIDPVPLKPVPPAEAKALYLARFAALARNSGPATRGREAAL